MNFPISLISVIQVAAAAQVIVSPAGPITTLVQARDAVRAQRQAGVAGTITVTIHPGTYFLPETLVLGPEDSNTVWEAAKGEHPVISGGRLLSGWTKTASAAWTAKATGAYFHQVFVDDKRAERTRTPLTGLFVIVN